MRICIVQCDTALDRENIRRVAQVAKDNPADVYILPELFAIGFDLNRTHAEYRRMAEQVDAGDTYIALSAIQAERPASNIIYGILENDHGNYYNSAVVIPGRGLVEAYRQKWPATANGKLVLPIQAGSFKTTHIGSIHNGYQTRIGLMICSDHFDAENFFKVYSDRKADAIVMIADSTAKPWITDPPKFHKLCSTYGLPLVICNAGGDDKGESCMIDAQGQVAKRLPEYPNYAFVELQ